MTSMIFLLSISILFLLNIIIYKTNKKAYIILNIILYILFFISYIEGNYLSYALPVLNGETINYSKFIINNYFSIILEISIIVISIILIKKYKIENYLKYSFYISIAIFFMLTASLVSSLITSDAFTASKNDFYSSATNANLNKYSSNNNFIILLLDAVDSASFKNAMDNHPELSASLKDFTYYKDTMSMYPFTLYSIPEILTGINYENEKSYTDYYVDSMKKSTLLKELYNNNYEVNIYETEFYFYDSEALKISNIINSKNMLDYGEYMENQIRYDLFKYLPYYLKKKAKIEKLDFLSTKVQKDDSFFNDDPKRFNKMINSNTVEYDDKNNFKFIHLTGAHVPFYFDINLNEKPHATYYDEIDGCLSLVNNYINYLKNNNIYDNSIIMIMADHGFHYDELNEPTIAGRQNPILFIKGINETHKKMIESDKSISYDDLSSAYIDLINNKKNKELFSNISTNRKRRYLYYRYESDEHIYEMETNGKAWETDKIIKTGKEYIRK